MIIVTFPDIGAISCKRQGFAVAQIGRCTRFKFTQPTAGCAPCVQLAFKLFIDKDVAFNHEAPIAQIDPVVIGVCHADLQRLLGREQR